MAADTHSQHSNIATFGGGCFWCTEAVFSRLKGVKSIVSGYADSKNPNPSYEQVSSGETGAVEAIQLEFDPSVITYEQLLEVFWATHDPTTLNQQGADVGTQYRSVIFFSTPEQKKAAESSKRAMKSEFQKPIVTQVEPLENFYTAEAYHQKYYDRHSDLPYCQIVISPKVQKLFEKFPKLLKEGVAK